MKASPVTRAYGRGCLRNAVVFPIGAFFGIVLVGFTLFVANRARPDQEAAAIAVVSIFFMFMMAAMVGIAVAIVKRRGRKLDRAFPAAGGPGSQVGARSRGWTRTVEGRTLRAWVSRGPRLELYLDSEVGTRGAIRRAGPVVRALSKSFLKEGEPVAPPAELADCEILCHDPRWLARLLARPGVAATAAELMVGTARVAPGVLWGPVSVGYLRAFLPLSEVTEANVERWTARLARIAAAVEELGPSSQGLEESRLETWSRTSRRLPVNPIWIGVGCAFLAVGLLTLLTLGLIAFLEP